MPFDPNKPYDVVEKEQVFDPNQPYDVVEQPSEVESYFRGALQGGTANFADEIEAKARQILQGKDNESAKTEIRQKYHAAQEANPKSYAAGQFTGAVGTSFIPVVGQVGKAGGLAARIAGNAGMGALQGYGENEGENVGRDIIGGGVMGGSVGALSEFIGGIPSSVRNFSSNRAAAALGAERGTIRKFGADKVRQAGETSLKEKILSSNTEQMQEGAKQLSKRSGERIGEIYDTIDDQVFPSFSGKKAATEFEQKHGGFYRAPLNRDISNQFDNIMDTIAGTGKKNLSINEAQEIKEMLGRAAKFDSATRASDDKALMAGQAYHIVKEHLDAAISRGEQALGTTDLLVDLQKNRRLYGDAQTMKALLTNKYAREQGNKMGTGLTNTIVGSEAMGIAAAGKPEVAVGMMAGKKAYEKFGQVSMAKSANVIANILETVPESLGKYAPMMMNAMQKGGQSLAVQHYVMSHRDPEYANLVKQAMEDTEKKKIELPKYGGIGADVGNLIDNATWTDKVGLDPQERDQSGFQYGEGVPQPASIKPPIMKFFKNDRLTEGRPILEVFKKLMAQEADGTISTVGKLQLEKLRKQYKAPITMVE